MRSSRQDMQKHREAIVASAARLFRERGVDGVSVPALMEAVGMTHGGFYKHFTSKEELVPIAYQKAFGDIAETLSKAAEHRGDGSWNGMLDTYLSPAHRDSLGAGCPTAAFAGDAARAEQDTSARTAYATGVDGMLATLAGLNSKAARDPGTLVALSTLVGALLLSRATDGSLSDAFLSAAKAHLAKH